MVVNIIRITIVSLLSIGLVVFMAVQTVQIFRETIKILRFKKKCTSQSDAVITKIQLTNYKGGKYKHRDAKATYEFIPDGETIIGKDMFYGLHSVTSPVEQDNIKICFDSSNPKVVYGYYSARRLRTNILYLVDFCILDLVILAGLVMIVIKICR